MFKLLKILLQRGILSIDTFRLDSFELLRTYRRVEYHGGGITKIVAEKTIVASLTINAVMTVMSIIALEEKSREVRIDALDALVQVTGSLTTQAVNDIAAVAGHSFRVVHVLRAVDCSAVVTVAGIACAVAVLAVLAVLVSIGHLWDMIMKFCELLKERTRKIEGLFVGETIPSIRPPFIDGIDRKTVGRRVHRKERFPCKI